MKKLIAALSIFPFSVSLAEDKPVVNEEVVLQIKELLKKAEAGKVHQYFVVHTGPGGISFSYSTTKEGELLLIGGLDWAKTHLVSDFDRRQREVKSPKE